MEATVHWAQVKIQSGVQSGGSIWIADWTLSIGGLVGLLAAFIEVLADFFSALGKTGLEIVDLLDVILDEMTQVLIFGLRWLGLGIVVEVVEISLVSVAWGLGYEFS